MILHRFNTRVVSASVHDYTDSRQTNPPLETSPLPANTPNRYLWELHRRRQHRLNVDNQNAALHQRLCHATMIALGLVGQRLLAWNPHHARTRGQTSEVRVSNPIKGDMAGASPVQQPYLRARLGHMHAHYGEAYVQSFGTVRHQENQLLQVKNHIPAAVPVLDSLLQVV